MARCLAVQLLFATSNPHKLGEVQAVLAPLGWQVTGLAELDRPPPEPPEDGATFVENARLKAIGYARSTGVFCLADDSGLMVDALGGAPGVHSARYAAAPGNRAARDEANNRKLLRELAGVPRDERTARFVCALCLARPDGTIAAESTGTCEGIIGENPRGNGGFGYDPLLYLPELGLTVAELSSEEKNARSHRGAAVRAMVERLRRGLP